MKNNAQNTNFISRTSESATRLLKFNIHLYTQKLIYTPLPWTFENFSQRRIIAFQTVPFEFSVTLHIVERINDIKKKRKIISPVRESLSSVFTDNTVDILLLKRSYRQYPEQGIPRRNNSIRLTEDDDALRSRFVCLAGNEEHFSRKISGAGVSRRISINTRSTVPWTVGIASRLENTKPIERITLRPSL